MSTDLLFVMHGTDRAAKIKKIMEVAYAVHTYPSTKDMLQKLYHILHEGLAKYPYGLKLKTATE